jgi:hypothetical protein
MMSLEARSIVYDNLRQVIDLKVDMSQTGLVSSNSRTIAQAHYEPLSWLRGLWHNNQAVGLIAMVDMLPDHPEADERDPHNAAYLWRLMIDQGFNGKALVAKQWKLHSHRLVNGGAVRFAIIFQPQMGMPRIFMKNSDYTSPIVLTKVKPSWSDWYRKTDPNNSPYNTKPTSHQSSDDRPNDDKTDRVRVLLLHNDYAHPEAFPEKPQTLLRFQS